MFGRSPSAAVFGFGLKTPALVPPGFCFYSLFKLYPAD
jgi:hypothetical protein